MKRFTVPQEIRDECAFGGFSPMRTLREWLKDRRRFVRRRRQSCSATAARIDNERFWADLLS